MRLAAGVDHQRAGAPPVLAAHLRPDAVDVAGRVGAGEGDPEKVVERSGGKGAVRELIEIILKSQGLWGKVTGEYHK